MDLTQKLQLARSGDEIARAELISSAYEELRKMARLKMANEREDHTLTATALVNEVSLRLLDKTLLPSSSRSEFFSYVSKAMRNLLIDHARSKQSQKRDRDRKEILIEEAFIGCDEKPREFLALNDALDALAELDPDKAQVVELRYFAGMSIEETATAMNTSPATVKRYWQVARAWLLKTLLEDCEFSNGKRDVGRFGGSP